MGRTNIAWTDETWNPVTGCTPAGEGCKNCYARALHEMRHTAAKNGLAMPKQYAKPFSEVQCFPNRLYDPLRWKKPRKVFVNSMGDLFHCDVPCEFIDAVFATIAKAPQHTYQVLTKRPLRMLEFCQHRPSLTNVWLGISCSTQAEIDRDVPILLETPAVVRFLSLEPLLESVDLGAHVARLSWVIVGGETGKGARFCSPAWIRGVIDQATPCFVKQLGSNSFPSSEDLLKIREYPRARMP